MSSRELKDFSLGIGAQETVLSLIAPYAPFKSSLDIGCSAGDFIIPISKSSKISHGVDIVDFFFAWSLIQEKYHNIHCSQLNLDLVDLPFEDQTFDLVTMLMVLEHVFDVHHAIKELSRVLILNGITVIQVPNIAYVKNRIELFTGSLPCTSDTTKRDNQTEWDGQHLRYFTLQSLKNLLAQHNLEVIKICCSGKFSQFRSLWTSLLGADLIVVAKKVQ